MLILNVNVSKIKKSVSPIVAFILSALSGNKAFFVWIGLSFKINKC